MSENEIAKLNDRFRTSLGISMFHGIPGTLVMTASIAALPPDDIAAILRKVREYNDFTEDNNPHGEHDFGAFKHGDKRIFWKIDYHGPDLVGGSEDPADLTKTVRVLTIMHSWEW
jgi:Protein of unknown function (DUF3768)